MHQQRTVQVTLPLGVRPGQQITLQTEQGPTVVVVPPGSTPGGPLMVQLPATPAAMPVAQPVAQPCMQPQGYQPPGPLASQSERINKPLLEPSSAPNEGGIVMGIPVHEAMPSLPSASSLTDQYSGYSGATEHPEEAGLHSATYDSKSGISDAASSDSTLPMGIPVYYTNEQLAILNQQPVPADMFTAGVKGYGPPTSGMPLPSASLPMAQSAHAAVSQPVLTP